MTTVRFYTRRGLYSGYRAYGHSGYTPQGSDIVCAAISALTQSTAPSLEKLLPIKPEIIADETSAAMRVLVPDAYGSTARRAHDLIASLRIGLSEIQRQYPDHIRVVGYTASCGSHERSYDRRSSP